jgi:hypothetical protein
MPGEEGRRKLNLKALFAAFDVPFDEASSKEVFARVVERLEQKEGEAEGAGAFRPGPLEPMR